MLYAGQVVEQGRDRATCCARRCIPTPRACWPRSRGSATKKRALAPFPAGCPICAFRRPAAGFRPRCPFAIAGERVAAGARSISATAACAAAECGRARATVAWPVEDARAAGCAPHLPGETDRRSCDGAVEVVRAQPRVRRSCRGLAPALTRPARLKAVDDVSLDDRGGRGARAGRRVRLGQDHARARDPAPDRARSPARSASREKP